jgi:hypothetical protein
MTSQGDRQPGLASLETISPHVEKQLDLQWEHWDIVDGRLRLLLGFVGAVFVAILALVADRAGELARAMVGLVVASTILLTLFAGCGGSGGEPSSMSTPTAGGRAEEESPPAGIATVLASCVHDVELSHEEAIQCALDLLAQIPENRPDPSTAMASRMTEREAWERLQREGVEGRSPSPPSERPVWLVEVRGEFVGFISGPPRPGRYFLILGLNGPVESGAFIPDAEE